MGTEPKVEYEVWREVLRNGAQYSLHQQPFGKQTSAQKQADEYNEDEAERAKIELRKVTERFFVVKATTTYAEVE